MPLLLAGSGFHDLTVQVPGRMSQHRHRDGEPDKQQQKPIAKPAAMIPPHIAMVSGLVITALTEVSIARRTPTLRSRSSGNETTLD
jgi:hypothetical protein